MNENDDYGNQGWRNWAGNLASVPDEIAQPAGLQDVQALVRNSGDSKLRCFGSKHSFSPLVVANDQTLVDLANYSGTGAKSWRWQQDGRDYVTFLPSAKWSDVRDSLTTRQSDWPQMYLSSTGALASINATGFVAAGCHGTGWNQPTVADYITEIELVAADGQVHVFSEAATPDEMPAIRANLGVLGIITKVTLGVEPLYKLHDQELVVPTENVMGPNPIKTGGEISTRNLHKLVTENEYVELFWFPGSGFDGEIWVKKFNRTQADVRDIPLRPDGWVDRMATDVMNWTAANPIFWNIVLPVAWGTIRDRCNAIAAKGGFVAEAPRVLFYADQAFPILDLEVAMPVPATGAGNWDLGNIVRAWYAALNYAYKHQGEFPLTTCLHARFTRSSQTLLSPAYSANSEDRVCWMEILSAYPKNEPDPGKRTEAMKPHLAMINEVIPTWINDFSGRPHWAKNWQYVEPRLNVRAMYPAGNLQRFNDLRRRLDPDGRFINPFLSQLNLFS